jgi:hypothetical protein
MKKILLALSIVFLFCGCSKEKTLIGETYAAYGYHVDDFDAGIIHMDGYDAYFVFRFIDESTAERSTRQYSPQGKVIGEMESCTYVLNYPTIEISYYSDAVNKIVVEKGEFLNDKTFRIGKYDYIKQ